MQSLQSARHGSTKPEPEGRPRIKEGRWLPLAVVFLATALVIGWTLRESEVNSPFEDPSREPREDAYIEGFVSVQMDEKGRPQRRLEAESLVHYQDGTSALTQPAYRFRRADDTIWWARSDRGWIEAPQGSTSAAVDDTQILRLEGSVNIWREEGAKRGGRPSIGNDGFDPADRREHRIDAGFERPGQGESEAMRAIDISLDELEIRPATGYAASDAFVTIRTPGSETQGTGLRVWLDEGKFRLLSRVSTRIDDFDRIP